MRSKKEYCYRTGPLGNLVPVYTAVDRKGGRLTFAVRPEVHKQVGVGCLSLRLHKAGCCSFDSPNMSVYWCCLGPESPIPLAEGRHLALRLL